MKKMVPRLCVAFDTNVLYTSVVHHLLRKDVANLLSEHSHHPDLQVEWYLSDVVIGEREYQMQNKAYEIYERVEILERLLDHQLTTKRILTDRIHGVIQEQLREYNIETLVIKEDIVNWSSLIRRSIYRRPPFNGNKKEKGFRDAIIGESFVQLVDRAPKTPSVCRLAFVSEDELLRTYLKKRLDDRQNVRILENLNELENLINTLVSNVPEEKISEWAKKAAAYFFQKDDDSTLYYRETIGQLISNTFAKELSSIPNVFVKRKNETYYIQAPVFVRKSRQRIRWMTEIRISSKLFMSEQHESLFSGALGLFADQQKSLGSLISQDIGKEVGSGVSTVEVNWSVSISQQRETLSRPKIEGVKFVETILDIKDAYRNTPAAIDVTS